MTSEKHELFQPIAADFAIELRSRTENLKTLQAKMQEYLTSGVKLGWLINPQDQQVEIYQQGQAVVTQPLPAMLSGGMLMPNFCHGTDAVLVIPIPTK